MYLQISGSYCGPERKKKGLFNREKRMGGREGADHTKLTLKIWLETKGRKLILKDMYKLD